MTPTKKRQKRGGIDASGLVIVLDQTLESCEWPKIHYLMRKGYTREEAVGFLPKLASGEIANIDEIPVQPSHSSEKEAEKK